LGATLPRPKAKREGAERRPTRTATAAAIEGGDGKPTFGAEGAAGIRAFGSAFAQTLPMAVSPDEGWKALPVGAAGHLDLRVRVDPDGHVVADPIDPRVAQHWRALVDRMLPMLRSGRFAFSTTQAGGVALLHLTATVSKVDPDAHGPGTVFGLGNDPAAPGVPGRGYWTLDNGKHYEVVIRLADETSTRPRR
jgi:hypothetical protein